MPVAAVTAGGRPSVSSGSANTTFARMCGEKMIRLTCVSSSLITALRPTSLPVPEVVGRATKHGSVGADRAHAADGRRRTRARSPPRGRDHADDLGDVERRAAADADDGVGAVRAERRRAGHHLARRRVAEHAAEDRRREPGGREVGRQLGDDRQRREALVGDDERALQAALAQLRADELARARAEVDRRRKGELGDGHSVDSTQMISK